MKGRIIGISGPTVTVDIPDLKLYDRVRLGLERLQGEVVHLSSGRAMVQVYEDTRGLALGEPAEGMGRPLSAQLGPGLLTGIFDGLQRPLSRMAAVHGPFIRPGKLLSPLAMDQSWQFTPAPQIGDTVTAGEVLGTISEGSHQHPVHAAAAGTLTMIASGLVVLKEPIALLAGDIKLYAHEEWPIRQPRPYRQKLAPTAPLITGQRIIDFLFPLAKGGTAILPGGFGTGKTILEQAIAKFADVDVVVYAGCGERGNEMAEMLEEFGELADPWSGQRLMDRTILVANTSNMPVAAREASIYTAVTMAEYYRDMGCHVLLLADSISRWAEALREISSAMEEMPGEEGYPTYLASRLAGFFSRAGVVETMNGRIGSLSIILSVSPPGGDFTEPATQACLRTSGAFLMLDTALAHRRHFPAINWFQSFSLYDADMGSYFEKEVSPAWNRNRRKCQALLQRDEKLREVAAIVGADGLQDSDHLLLAVAERIRQDFLCQNSYSADAFSTPELTAEKINTIISWGEAAEKRLTDGEELADILSKDKP
ncbi:MAG: V-type ATP synthase subunit A [Desulfoarculaceae bacterium]|nr:V-type ATP synthase subunit A [Desulfoarculaceae bacterium]